MKQGYTQLRKIIDTAKMPKLTKYNQKFLNTYIMDLDPDKAFDPLPYIIKNDYASFH